MLPTIFLDDIPEYAPREFVKEGEPWIKHVLCDGARFHVLNYYGISTDGGHRVTRVHTRCSEPDCIYNKPVEESSPCA